MKLYWVILIDVNKINLMNLTWFSKRRDDQRGFRGCNYGALNAKLRKIGFLRGKSFEANEARIRYRSRSENLCASVVFVSKYGDRKSTVQMYARGEGERKAGPWWNTCSAGMRSSPLFFAPVRRIYLATFFHLVHRDQFKTDSDQKVEFDSLLSESYRTTSSSMSY